MKLTEEEREVLTRVLGRLLTGENPGAPTPTLTVRERRELVRKAQEDGEKKKD